jgi:hypothetical protein
MTARPCLVALLCSTALALPACGAAATVTAKQSAAQRHTSGDAAASPSAFFIPLPSHPVHTGLDMSRPIHTETDCSRLAVSLADEVRRSGPDAQPQMARAALVATVVSTGTPVWNTADGHRWTQAEINAGTPVAPHIYTPYRLRVQRLLSPAAGLAAGGSITAYLLGGTTPYGDREFDGCGPAVAPRPGGSAVVLLGGEVDTGAAGSAPLRRPTIDEVDVIENGEAITWQGPQPVP